MEAIMLIILQFFFAMRTVSKIGEYSQMFPTFGWGMFSHMTCLDQSCMRKYLMDYKHDYVITMLLLVTCWSTQPSFVLLRFSAGLTPKIANKNIQWRTVPWTISLYELCSVWVKTTVQELLGFFASPIQRGFQTSWKHLEMFPQGSQGSCKTWKVMEFYKFSGHGMSWKSTTFREWTGKKVQCWKTDRQVRKPVNSSKQVP